MIRTLTPDPSSSRSLPNKPCVYVVRKRPLQIYFVRCIINHTVYTCISIDFWFSRMYHLRLLICLNFSFITSECFSSTLMDNGEEYQSSFVVQKVIKLYTCTSFYNSSSWKNWPVGEIKSHAPFSCPLIILYWLY